MSNTNDMPSDDALSIASMARIGWCYADSCEEALKLDAMFGDSITNARKDVQKSFDEYGWVVARKRLAELLKQFPAPTAGLQTS